MRCALHRQAVNFLAKLQDIALMLAKASLHPTHPEIKRAQPTRSFSAAKLGLLLDSTYLLKRLLLFLPNIVFEACLCVSNIALKVTADNSYLIEAIAQRILRCVKAFLRCRKVFVGEVDAAIQ